MTPAVPRALVVEDDPSWQQILGELLSDSGLAVDAAGNADEAVQLLKSEPHRLAVVDLSLAGGDHHNEDGLRVLEAVRRLDPACRAILLTGFATVELAVSALTEHGAFSFLRKENFKRAEFRELIGRALSSPPAGQDAADKNVQPAEAGAEQTGPGAASRPSRALVVEDDAGWRSILSELLADACYEVRPCVSFGDALGALRREKFTLAIVDLSLTSAAGWGDGTPAEALEGYQLLATTHAAGIPTIVVSGIASVEEIRRAYAEHSIFAYLEKQAFDRATFRRLVEEARRSGGVASELDCLTEREREVLDLLAKGLTNKEIALKLIITENTVKRHIKAIFEKLDVHTRSGAAARAVQNQEREQP